MDSTPNTTPSEEIPIKGNPILDLYEANKKCFDCENENPRFISVNNAITLCKNCCEEHKKLGNSISYIRSLEEPYDEYILTFFKKGGNAKLKFIADTLNVDLKLPIEKKYKTYAFDYYRRNLKKKVLGEKEIEVDFPLEKVNEEVENAVNTFPEFDNYKINNNEEEEEELFKGAPEWLNKFSSKLKMFGRKVTDKIKEMEIKEKIKNGGNVALNGLKKTGTFIAEKTAPGREKIAEGASKIGEGVSNAFNTVKSKIVKKAVNESVSSITEGS